MARGFGILLAGLVGSLALPGCSAHRCCGPALPRAAGSASLEVLPVVERSALRANLDALRVPQRPRTRLPAGAGLVYYALTPPECQCRAVEASSLGNLLASEGPAQQAAVKGRRQPGDRGRTLVLAASSDEARNLSAAKALAIYYALAEGEARLDLSDQALAELDDVLAKIGQMRQQGLEIPVDPSELERKRTELESERAELELAIARGNHELFRSLDLDVRDRRARIWPQTELRVDAVPLDEDLEIEIGLATRPEIRVLRLLARLPPSESVAATKMLLGGLNPMLGGASAMPLRLVQLVFAAKHLEAEAPARRRQLAELRQRRELELADEIRQAVEAIETRTQRAILAKENLESCRRLVADTEKKQPISKATFVDLATSRLKLIEAESAAVSAAVAWQGAVLQLRQLQGRLAEECSLGPGGWCGAVSGGPSEQIIPPPPADVQEPLPSVVEELPDAPLP